MASKIGTFIYIYIGTFGFIPSKLHDEWFPCIPYHEASHFLCDAAYVACMFRPSPLVVYRRNHLVAISSFGFIFRVLCIELRT